MKEGVTNVAQENYVLTSILDPTPNRLLRFLSFTFI